MQVLTGKKVLVTGGAGFIGSNIITTLLSQENHVTCLDNLSTGKKTNITTLIDHPRFTFIEGDIRNLKHCLQALGNNTEYVLHQAALASVPRSIQDPITTNEVNINGFLNMLIAAKEKGVKRFVYAASSSVYGDQPTLLKIEENTANPLSPYAITKYANELYANIFSNLYHMELIGLRYFNVFGKKQDPEGAYAAVIPKFIKALIQKESPIIYGDGTQSRDFTYIDDVVQINQLALVSQNRKAINQVYNVACSESTTLNQLFELVRGSLSKFDSAIKNISPRYGSPRQGDIKHSLAAIDKAKKYLNYRPQYDIKKGLEKAITWYWEHYA